MPGRWDTDIYQGEKWTRVLEIRDEAGAVVPLQAPGFADIRASLRSTSARLARMHTTAGADGTVTLDVAAGRLTLLLPAAITAAFTPGGYFMDVWVHDASGAPMPLVAGQVTVRPRVSLP
jgi:hypothetical protein